MTKAEAFIYNSPRWKCTRRVVAKRHDGTDYYINVYVSGEYNEIELHCDSYYGDSILYRNGVNLGNVEMEYDTRLKELI